ncbi:MAG: protein TolR [Gammaproteobacteria bacterium]
MGAQVNSRHARRRMMSEINVVPYIDVMLVLLIIFMVTAPLITQGVRIELPQAPSEVLPPSDQEPVIVSVAADGRVYVDIGENPDQPVDDDALMARVAAVVQFKPDTEVLVEGDRNVDYGRVVEIMTLLKRAGVSGVGLITEPPE